MVSQAPQGARLDAAVEKQKPRTEPGLLLHGVAGCCHPTATAGPKNLDRRDDDRRTALFALDGERDLTVDQREQRVVLAHADVRAGVELGTADAR